MSGTTGGVIRTVRGEVPAESIGFTLPHEHAYLDIWHIRDRHDYAGQIPDAGLLASELTDFRDLGGSCFVDLTTRGIGRDPLALRDLSERSQVHIVMGSGWYREPYYPPEDLIDRRTVDDLADIICDEALSGVDGTGVHPGIIGEIGAHKSWISAQEERVCRAAARAARRTGMAVSTHSVFSPVGLSKLEIFEEEGLDPARVVIGHASTYPIFEFYRSVVNEGAHLAFDTLGYQEREHQHLEDRVTPMILDLIEMGHIERIFLSQDVCLRKHLRRFGGEGYTYIQRKFLARLRSAGLDDDAIVQITETNPRTLLTLAHPTDD